MSSHKNGKRANLGIQIVLALVSLDYIDSSISFLLRILIQSTDSRWPMI